MHFLFLANPNLSGKLAFTDPCSLRSVCAQKVGWSQFNQAHNHLTLPSVMIENLTIEGKGSGLLTSISTRHDMMLLQSFTCLVGKRTFYVYLPTTN